MINRIHFNAFEGVGGGGLISEGAWPITLKGGGGGGGGGGKYVWGSLYERQFKVGQSLHTYRIT